MTRLGSLTAVWLLVAAGAATLLAADPQLRQLTPYGAQRGTEIEVLLEGARLADARELLLYDPGIRVAALTAVEKNSNAVKAKLAITPDCRLGMHALRVRTATGLSNLLTFSVGALKEIAETEPNNEFESPQKIDLDTTVNGVVQNEDVDYFLAEAKKGERISVEIEGLRLGETFFDPYVAILDSGRFVLAGSDDTTLVHQDAACSAIAPKDGAYVIQVRESSFGGSGQCRYRLHVGRFPRPLAVFPPGGKPGQTLDVRWLGDPAGPWTEKITLPSATEPIFGLTAHDGRGVAPSPNDVRVVDLGNVVEAEPNNVADKATPFEAPKALNGVIAQPGDVDCYKFSAKKGQVYDVRVQARSLRSPLDSVLTIRRIGGAGVGSSDDAGTPDSYLRFRTPADDQYVISIQDQLLSGGPEYVYRIEVAPVAPELTMSLPERTRYVDVTAAVPRGNRTAVMVGATRADFGGDVNVQLKGAPAGVTFQTVPMTGDQTQVPLLLSATADAPVAGTLADLLGIAKLGDRTLEGHLRQHTSLVRGQNNRDVWSHDTQRMATAVTETVPYRIDIVQPKVPLVQNGSMALKVVAAREGGFKAPITLRMLYNPPGVSSPTTVVMPEGKSEAIVPLTANGGAAVRKWKIAVTGDATVGDGQVTVSSQLADLEVTEPFFKFNFPTVSAEQGQQTVLAVKVEKNRDFEGAAKVELLGLPNEVTTEPQQITKDSTAVTFTLRTTANSPPGRHRGLICRAVLMAQGEPITHTLGSGELRIFKPLPAKPASKAKPQPKPAGKPQPKPAAQPLSRLEQLRLEREKAAKQGQPAAKP